jgi:hypothetical protein
MAQDLRRKVGRFVWKSWRKSGILQMYRNAATCDRCGAPQHIH